MFAQDEYGSLRGQIIDQASGAAIAGASVALLEDPIFFARTDLNGGFSFQDVPTGTYTIRVFKGGFDPYDVTGLLVQTGGAARVDISLPRRKAEVVETPVKTGQAHRSDIFEMAAFEVTAEIIRNTEASLLSERQPVFSASLGKWIFFGAEDPGGS